MRGNEGGREREKDEMGQREKEDWIREREGVQIRELHAKREDKEVKIGTYRSQFIILQSAWSKSLKSRINTGCIPCVNARLIQSNGVFQVLASDVVEVNSCRKCHQQTLLNTHVILLQ